MAVDGWIQVCRANYIHSSAGVDRCDPNMRTEMCCYVHRVHLQPDLYQHIYQTGLSLFAVQHTGPDARRSILRVPGFRLLECDDE